MPEVFPMSDHPSSRPQARTAEGARANSISINKLVGELATVALANYDARVRFETRAARGNPKRALALLDKLDRAG